MFFFAMTFGYLAFGDNCEGTVLNNYAKTDELANIARIGMGFANVFSFPLMFSGLREALIALVIFCAPSCEETAELVFFQHGLRAIMLEFIILVTGLVTDASLVVGFVGFICGSAIIYVIPCYLFAHAYGQSHYSQNPKEVRLVKAIGVIGVALMFAGAYATVAF